MTSLAAFPPCSIADAAFSVLLVSETRIGWISRLKGVAQVSGPILKMFTFDECTVYWRYLRHLRIYTSLDVYPAGKPLSIAAFPATVPRRDRCYTTSINIVATFGWGDVGGLKDCLKLAHHWALSFLRVHHLVVLTATWCKLAMQAISGGALSLRVINARKPNSIPASTWNVTSVSSVDMGKQSRIAAITLLLYDYCEFCPSVFATILYSSRTVITLELEVYPSISTQAFDELIPFRSSWYGAQRKMVHYSSFTSL